MNEDVCALSTACSQTEQELKNKQEETTEAIKKWEDTEEIPTKEILASILANQRDVILILFFNWFSKYVLLYFRYQY